MLAVSNDTIQKEAKLGALENGLDHTVNNLSNVATNTTGIAQVELWMLILLKRQQIPLESQILSPADNFYASSG